MCGLTSSAHASNVNARQEPTGARIEDTVKDFWATRPRRPRRGRKIAGVAAGIANRYRIDPVVVRVGLAVAAIYGGSGVLIYLLGWLFLPEQDDEVSPVEALFGKGRSSTSSAFTVLLGLFLLPISGWFFSGAFTGEFSSWLSLLVLGGLLFLLHQARGGMTPVTPPMPGQAAPTPPPPPMPTMPMASASAAPTAPYGPYVPPAAATPPPVSDPVPEPRTTPPAWDPLGAAPFAWDLPEPATPEPEEPPPPAKRRKPRVAMATLGLVLVTAAGLALAANAPWGRGWITPQHAIGVVLAVIGLGLVFGAFLRAGRGLILLAVPLALAGMGMTAVSPGGYRGIGDLNASPTTIAGVQPVYERSVGTISLDLTGLPASGHVMTEAHTDLGTVEVTVPETADVTVTCEADAGTAECLGQESSGPESVIAHYESLGTDGEGGLQITLIASTNAGTVEVRRG